MLGPAAWQLVSIHPYELSYYNELIGGPRGASRAGFELSYWYEPFNDRTIAEINERLPRGATVDFLNPMSTPETFAELQALGHLRGDIKLGLREPDRVSLRLAVDPGFEGDRIHAVAVCDETLVREPSTRSSIGLRVATVADPIAVSRAWALELLVDAPSGGRPNRPRAPAWVHSHATLARLVLG